MPYSKTSRVDGFVSSSVLLGAVNLPDWDRTILWNRNPQAVKLIKSQRAIKSASRLKLVKFARRAKITTNLFDVGDDLFIFEQFVT